jgi:hypothetical protein
MGTTRVLRALALGVVRAARSKFTPWRRPARWCPLCGECARIREWRWWWIEARDEEVVCLECCRIPRTWLAGRPG